MTIVNFFFWVMLLLLGLLTGLLVDSFARTEKMALTELSRLERTARRPQQAYPADRRQLLSGAIGDRYRIATDDRRSFSGNAHRPSIDQRQPASIRQNQACFFAIGVAAFADHQDDLNIEPAGSQTAFAYEFSLPHAAGYVLAHRQNERTVQEDCPSCA